MVAPHAKAKLLDVFEISGRGVVIVVGEIEGVVQVGDVTALDDQNAQVSGIELVKHADPATQPSGTTELLIEGIGKVAVLPLIGNRLAFSGKG